MTFNAALNGLVMLAKMCSEAEPSKRYGVRFFKRLVIFWLMLEPCTNQQLVSRM